MVNQTRKVVLAGLFVAASIILTRFFAGNIIVSGITVLRLSFGQIPIFLSGFLLGPLYGGLSGAIADVVGYVINPQGGPYFPGFTLNAAISGLIPGLFAKFKPRYFSWVKILMVIAISEFITSICLTPIWLSILTGKAFFVFIPSNLISRIFMVPIHAVIIKVLLKYSFYVIPNLE